MSERATAMKGTKAQIVAEMKAQADSYPGVSIQIVGSPEHWSVSAWWSTTQGSAAMWLASTRDPSRAREFKTLEAAWTSARELMIEAGREAPFNVNILTT